LPKRHVRRNAPVVVVVHKAVRRERIRPYRWSVPVSRETSSRGPAGSRRAFAKARTSWQGGAYTYAHTHTHVHDAYGSRAGSRRGGERIIEPVKSFCCYITPQDFFLLISSTLISNLIAISDSYRLHGC